RSRRANRAACRSPARRGIATTSSFLLLAPRGRRVFPQRLRPSPRRPRQQADTFVYSTETTEASIVSSMIETRKKHAGEAEFAEVADPHRVKLADQVIALVLNDAGV